MTATEISKLQAQLKCSYYRSHGKLKLQCSGWSCYMASAWAKIGDEYSSPIVQVDMDSGL